MKRMQTAFPGLLIEPAYKPPRVNPPLKPAWRVVRLIKKISGWPQRVLKKRQAA